MNGAVKPKTCKVCRSDFVPAQFMARVCSPSCALTLVQTKRARVDQAARAAERRADRAKRELLKTKGDWTREAQAAFNAFIRARDAGLPCICCGRTGSGDSHGGEWDAGHYRSRGSAPHLRFDERNVHAQLKQCNRYDSGNIVGYRAGLIARIGLDAVEALESDQEPRRYTIEQLAEIKREYSTRVREIKKGKRHE